MRKLQKLTPDKTELDPIEVASLEDIRKLQRERLSWTLKHAYDNVPHYRAKFDSAGVKPSAKASQMSQNGGHAWNPETSRKH